MLAAAIQEMSYARSEPVASVLEERQKQCFYSYQCPYLKTTVNITAQLALLDYWWRTSTRPSQITRVIWAHVGNSCYRPFGLQYTKAVINQVAETHPTAYSVSTFFATPVSITFSPGLHDFLTI